MDHPQIYFAMFVCPLKGIPGEKTTRAREVQCTQREKSERATKKT
ncbi:predicted protein [Botrytis cinerea T4]|uniref:Uncharacterized protein n=1 Tax=Botryotinia fuckeliana (strain T4) TaxID=999810 RepID=G2YN55_BOTF4|nr:predicted protein [Botrytis cinerea T4]